MNARNATGGLRAPRRYPSLGGGLRLASDNPNPTPPPPPPSCEPSPAELAREHAVCIWRDAFSAMSEVETRMRDGLTPLIGVRLATKVATAMRQHRARDAFDLIEAANYKRP